MVMRRADAAMRRRWDESLVTYPLVHLSRLILEARPELSPAQGDLWFERLSEDRQLIPDLKGTHPADRVMFVRAAMNQYDDRPHTVTRMALSMEGIILQYPLHPPGNAVYFALRGASRLVVTKRFTPGELVGYQLMAKLRMSEDDMVAEHLAPFIMFDAHNITRSGITTVLPAKESVAGSARMQKRFVNVDEFDCNSTAASSWSTNVSPIALKVVQRRPTLAPPGVSSSSAVVSLLRNWCWMPRYTVTLADFTRPFTADAAELVIEHISMALARLHESGHAHMDVKPHNIFVTSEGDFLLGDFGSVRKFGGFAVQTTQKFVPMDRRRKDEYRVSMLHDWWMLAMTVCDVELHDESGTRAADMTTSEVISVLNRMNTNGARSLLKHLQ